MLNLIYVNLREGRDEEALLTIDKDLDRLGEIRHPYYSFLKINKKRHLVAVKDRTESETVVAPKDRWRAPPGWTPVGWNEAQSYANAKSFMKFQANPGTKK